MKVLLINPPGEFILPESPDDKGRGFLQSDDFGRFPPLGLLYVLSYLETRAPHHELYFRDCIAEGISHARLGKVVAEIRPDVVGITSFTIALVDVRTAAETVRRVAPHAHIVLGGHHPIAFPREAAQLRPFDSMVVGEGEEAFSELVSCLERGESFTHVPGVYTRDSMERWACKALPDAPRPPRVSPPAACIEDLDALPVPNRRHIRHINYCSIVGGAGKMATILSSRGCPYRCTFCEVPYKHYRSRAIDAVVDEMEACLALGYREFHFYDDLFNITPGKVLTFCDEVERRGMKPTWDFRGRVNGATRQSLFRARKTGCRMITFGVETGTDEGLRILKKGTTVEEVRQVFAWCREAGIRTIADFMIGFPFERSIEDIRRNIDFLIGLDPDYTQISVLMVLPNTAIYEDAIRKGIVREGAWEAFCLNPTTDFQISHWGEHLTLQELVAMKKRAYRRFYFRPRYIWRSLLNTRSAYELFMKAKGVVKLLGGRSRRVV